MWSSATGGNHSRSHKHDLWSNFVPKSLNAENLLRTQRQVKALKLCERPRRQSSSLGCHGIESPQLETSCDLRRLLGLKTCVTSESSSDKLGTSGEAKTNFARLARSVAESSAHASARERKARHASMECSVIEPARSSESGASTSIFPSFHGAVDVLDLTGLSATPPQDIIPVKELWTTSGAFHEEREGGFGFGHPQVRGEVERRITGKAVFRFYENVFDASELIKKASAAQAMGTRINRDQRQSVPTLEQAEIGKYCELPR